MQCLCHSLQQNAGFISLFPSFLDTNSHSIFNGIFISSISSAKEQSPLTKKSLMILHRSLCSSSTKGSSNNIIATILGVFESINDRISFLNEFQDELKFNFHSQSELKECSFNTVYICFTLSNYVQITAAWFGLLLCTGCIYGLRIINIRWNVGKNSWREICEWMFMIGGTVVEILILKSYKLPI